MLEAVKPTEGLGVLHLFCKAPPGTGVDAILTAERVLGAPGHEVEADEHRLVAAAILGHKADLCLMAYGPNLWRLRRFQTDVAATGLEIVDSYMSLTEVSEYAKGMPEERLRARLYPTLPPEGKPAFCFYPMSKRRGETDNWYALPYADREKLMLEHGQTGRTFSGRVLQLVTGSTGLDDFEWGVTLFAEHPNDLKECVYTMRFDTASARYAEFGEFYVGMVGALADILYDIGVRD